MPAPSLMRVQKSVQALVYGTSFMCAAARAGNAAEAAALDAKLALLHRDLFLEPNPIPVKWALHHMGRIPPGLRLPMVPMSADIQPRIIAALQAAEVIA